MSDLISRQDAIDAVKHAWAKGFEPTQYIEILPSVYTDEQIQKIQDMEQAALEKAYECGRQDALSSESDVARDIATIIENEQDMRVLLRARKTGEWEFFNSMENCFDIAGVPTWANQYICKNCGFVHTVIEDFGIYNFCPNCGAYMKGEKDE